MDITPQVINEVEFRKAVRGYDLDEVDDFLERMAVSVGQLLERLHAAEQRAVDAERRLAEGGGGIAPAPAEPAQTIGPAPDADAISRALIAAQRTADALVQEARDEASRATSSTQEQVRQLLEDAQAQSQRLVAEAELEAEHAHAEARGRVVADIERLEGAREALSADVSLLEAHFEEQRLRLRASIDELHRLLDDPGRLRLSPPPALSGVSMPVPAPAAAAVPLGEEAAAAADDAPGDTRTDAPRAVAEAAVAHGDEPASWEAPVAPMPVPQDDTTPDVVDDPETTDDAYLAELRRAMIEDDDEFGSTANLFGPDPDADLDLQGRARSRFGRRR